MWTLWGCPYKLVVHPDGTIQLCTVCGTFLTATLEEVDTFKTVKTSWGTCTCFAKGALEITLTDAGYTKFKATGSCFAAKRITIKMNDIVKLATDFGLDGGVDVTINKM